MTGFCHSRTRIKTSIRIRNFRTQRHNTALKVFAASRGHVKYTRLPDRTYVSQARTEEELTRHIYSIGEYSIGTVMLRVLHEFCVHGTRVADPQSLGTVRVRIQHSKTALDPIPDSEHLNVKFSLIFFISL
jgi:hypothetical protein